MLVVIWLLLIIIGLIFHKSKRIAWLQTVFMIFVMGLNSKTADYVTYSGIYNNIVSGGTPIFDGNWLFKLFYFVVGKLTNFQFVLFVTALIGMVLIYKTILYYTDSVALVLSFYMIASFVIDATQTKNFLAMSVWFYFSRYLYEAYMQKKYGEIATKAIYKYCLGVFLSMGIHVSFGVTIVFLLVVFLDLKKVCIITILTNVIAFSLEMFTRLENLFAKIANSGNSILRLIYFKYRAYAIGIDIDNIFTRAKLTILFFIILLVIVGIVLLAKKKEYYQKEYKLLNFMVMLNLMAVCCIPLYFFSVEFYRIQRNLLLIDYIALQAFILGSATHKLRLRLGDVLLNIFIIGLAFFYLYIDAILWNFDSVFKALFF